MAKDLVDDAFERMRQAARKHGGAPSLSKPPRPKRSQPKPEGTIIPGVAQVHELGEKDRHTITRRGYGETGPDGRRRRRSYDVPRLSAVVSREIAERGWEEDLAKGWVYNHWPHLVGDKIAQHTTVEMIKDSTVFISCDSTAWATNLKYMQTPILSAIAKKIGPNIVTKLHIYPPKTRSWKKGRLHVAGRGPRDTYG